MAVTNISRGDGILYLRGFAVGYLSGGVTAALDVTMEKFTAGSPKRTIVQVPVGASFTLKAGLAEISKENMARAMGHQATTELTTGTVNFTAAYNTPFILDPPTGEEVILLTPGMGIGDNFRTLVLKDSAGAVTYDITDDYLIDADTGRVTRVDGGAILTLATVKVFSFTYDKIVGARVDIGFEQELQDVPLCFVHTNPKTQKRTFVYMHKAQSDGKFSLGFGDDWLKTDVTWEALESATHTDNTLGYVVIEE